MIKKKNSNDWICAKVHFIAGKGGVGKTLISQALARFFAVGHKTLLVELSEDDTGEERPRIAKIKEDMPGNLCYLKIFPDQALYEYLHMKLPSQKILESLLSQDLFRAMSSAMPGLSDLTRLGKIWYHADDVQKGQRQIFDKIVIDMPSSGFVKRFLTIPRVVRDAVKIGPLAKEADLIDRYLAKKDNARLHLVALPEELVVNETAELLEQMSEVDSIHLGAVLVNRVCDLNMASISRFIEKFRGKAPHAIEALQRMKARLLEQQRQLDRLSELKSAASIYLDDIIGESMESRIIDKMMARLERELS